MRGAAELSFAEEVDVARLRHIRPRHYGRIVAVIAILAFAAFLIRAFAIGRIDWSTTREYLTWPSILLGLVNTLWMSVACMAIGIVIGVLCAVARGSPNPVLRVVAIGYAWFFRGTPVILQLLIWFNLGLVFPYLGIPGLFTVRTVNVITPAIATLLGLGLNEGAYASEIMRSGMLSVDHGQYEASKAIGMSYLQSLRRIILPQAMRVVVPAARQRVHRLDQDHFAGEHNRLQRRSSQCSGYLLRQRQGDRTPDGRRLLVSGRRLDPLCRTSHAGAPLRSRICERHKEMTSHLVSAVKVGKRFGAVQALEDVTLDVEAGEVVCIIGPSGSGKTTFLRCINQLERIDSGALWLNGELTGYRRVGDALHPLSEKEIARQRRATGMVFQRFNLFPHMTALENVTEGPIQVLKQKPS